MRKLLSNRLLISLLCAALLFKAVVPVGFMPDFGALQQGIYKITICSGLGSQSIFVDQNMKQVDGGQQNSGHKSEKSVSCPFAGIHVSTLPIAGFAVALLLLWRQVRYTPRAATEQSVALSAAWPRGPPAILA